eukprot:CAMPEP_0202000700 /NCGR_PEP_ID=MMETSP0905-20130828/6990_1 /ASSEMBLY_ACC=CAM_ASM_000554 /TAXON_ID=420261 /ORGANISM="Thalassiosira antarctica, Strain CCMP982" /LENGTH=226 /DNA_ID=CAMNT_0048557249 /DNA_START=19 /DNA_END=699 /DNA_ORIENTATION=-
MAWPSLPSLFAIIMGSNHLRRFYKGAILATAIPCSILYPSTASAFVQLPVHSPHNSQPTLSVVYQQRLVHSSSVLQMTPSIDKEEKSYIDKLALILINSKKEQLLARSYGKGVFYTPGGKREPGESDKEALIRECYEELSVDLSTSTIDRYGTFEAQAYGKPEGTMVRMTCFRVLPRDAELKLEQLVKASEEVEELKWINSSFDRERLTVTGIMIMEDLKEKGLID